MSSYSKLVYYLSLVLGVLFHILGLIYGIFALIPTGPFLEQNKSLGITLLVLSCFCIPGLTGIIIGSCAFGTFCLPCAFLSDETEEYEEGQAIFQSC